MVKEMALPRTLTEAVKYFAVPDNCLSYLVARRWPAGVTCPACGSQKVHFDRTRMGWRCTSKHAMRKFTLKTGTIFEDSPLGLDKWLPCAWMIANMKNGVSSHEIARSLGVTQKTAWFMLHRIRLAMQDIRGGKLAGDIEVDETYIGGKARNMHASKRARHGFEAKGKSMAGKVAVMGLLDRHGKNGVSQIRTTVLRGRRTGHMIPVVRDHVEYGSTINTDAHLSYQSLGGAFIHNVIDHAEKYVDGQVHTNGCENYWSLLKRALKGTYVSVEPFHLFRYLDEQAFRFNHRKHMNDADRFSVVISQIVSKRLMYKDLIAALSAGTAPS